jgi:hypothetical protein
MTTATDNGLRVLDCGRLRLLRAVDRVFLGLAEGWRAGAFRLPFLLRCRDLDTFDAMTTSHIEGRLSRGWLPRGLSGAGGLPGESPRPGRQRRGRVESCRNEMRMGDSCLLVKFSSVLI